MMTPQERATIEHEPTATRECIELAFIAYMECALWSSYDRYNPEPLDQDHTIHDISPETRLEMLADVVAFLNECWEDELDLGAIEPGQFGHDFWLTRNGHGTGFWDRGLGELGDTLTSMTRPYGSVDLYIGDDGLIYA